MEKRELLSLLGGMQTDTATMENSTRACVHAQSLQAGPALRSAMSCSPPDFSVHEFSWQEYLSGLPCPPPGDLPDPGTEPTSSVPHALQADSLHPGHPGSPWRPAWSENWE